MPEGTVADAALLRGWPLPAPGSDKEERGLLTVVAGSRTTPGAGLLSVEAAFRVGAGKVRLATAASCASALAAAAPELMVIGLGEDDHGSIAPAEGRHLVGRCDGSSAVLLGPGFTDPPSAAALVGEVVPRLGGRVVLDALATAYVTDNHEEVASLDATVVLTVNPLELARCLGTDEEEVEADLAAHTALLARRTRTVVSCGGPVKVVADGEELWRVQAGNPGLGTARSRDVLSGIRG